MAGGSRPGRSILPLYRIFMTLTYTIPSCCMSRLIAFIVPPPGVRVWREVWLIFPPLNLGTHHLDGEQNKIGNNTPAKSRLCEGLLRLVVCPGSTFFRAGSILGSIFQMASSHSIKALLWLFLPILPAISPWEWEEEQNVSFKAIILIIKVNYGVLSSGGPLCFFTKGPTHR